jgi:allophanate hydrolase subunit 1
MSKKLTQEELKELQEAVNGMNNLQLQIGGLEAQKHELLHSMETAKSTLAEVQKKLEDIYGQVSVDISTGDIKENESSTED